MMYCMRERMSKWMTVSLGTTSKIERNQRTGQYHNFQLGLLLKTLHILCLTPSFNTIQHFPTNAVIKINLRSYSAWMKKKKIISIDKLHTHTHTHTHTGTYLEIHNIYQHYDKHSWKNFFSSGLFRGFNMLIFNCSHSVPCLSTSRVNLLRAEVTFIVFL